jgi:uncharacterized spore protein YtfJ
MNMTEVVDTVRETLSVTRVFGQPIERDGTTVIPVATITGGAGGGGGEDKTTGGSGSGAGFGVSAKPAGVYVLRDGKVSWQPAMNLNRVIAGGQLIGLVAVLTIRGLLKRRAKRR